jgi:hypothetical protein
MQSDVTGGCSIFYLGASQANKCDPGDLNSSSIMMFEESPESRMSLLCNHQDNEALIDVPLKSAVIEESAIEDKAPTKGSIRNNSTCRIDQQRPPI